MLINIITPNDRTVRTFSLFLTVSQDFQMPPALLANATKRYQELSRPSWVARNIVKAQYSIFKRTLADLRQEFLLPNMSTVFKISQWNFQGSLLAQYCTYKNWSIICPNENTRASCKIKMINSLVNLLFGKNCVCWF